MELHAPLKFRREYPVIVTQLFGKNPHIYKPMGLAGHNGIDFVSGMDMNAYGVSLVASHDGLVTRVVAEEPMSTKGNGVYTQWEEDGKLYMAVYWHMSEVLVKAGDIVKCGQVIGKMGNSGYVFPAPGIKNPFAGTHLHYGLYVSEKVNGVWQRIQNEYGGAIDPLPLFSPRTHALNFNEYRECEGLERMKMILIPFRWATEKIRKAVYGF
jgi:murein DD-endopeptidase MepM/ murein hydrolase activator NlpD